MVQNEGSSYPEGKRKYSVIGISEIQRKHRQIERKICFDRNTLKDDKYETVTSDTSYVLVNLFAEPASIKQDVMSRNSIYLFIFIFIYVLLYLFIYLLWLTMTIFRKRYVSVLNNKDFFNLNVKKKNISIVIIMKW